MGIHSPIHSLPYRVELIFPKKWYQRVQYRLLEDVYIAGVHVPKGFVTDGASVPRLFWVLFPPMDQYFPAAVVHDYLLVEGTPWPEANKYFRRALRESKIPSWRRKLMEAAVGLYGEYQMAKVRLGRYVPFL